MADIAVSHLERDLAAIVGSRAIVTEDRARYETGYRYGEGSASAIVRPGSREEVRQIVRYCHARDISLLPQGAHTGLVGAATPGGEGERILLSLDRINAIANYAPLDRMMTVGAGTLFSAVNEKAGEDGLFFPIDLGADPSIGGMISTNTGGAKLIRYGDVRRNLLGLEVVLPDEDASVWSDLGGLRKDNTGLDLKQLFVGSGGRLGIITAATINLQRRPRQAAAALLVPGALADMPRILANLEGALGELLSACEVMSRAAMDLSLKHHPSLTNPFPSGGIPPFVMLVEATSGTPEGGGIDIEAVLAEALWPMMEGDGACLEDVLLTDKGDFWSLRHAISDGLKREGKVLAFDVSTARSRLPELIERLTGLVAEIAPDVLACPFGHFGDGGVHFNLVLQSETELDEAAIRDAVYAVLVDEFSGSISAEHGIGPYNWHYYELHVPEWKQGGIAALERQFDPRMLLR